MTFLKSAYTICVHKLHYRPLLEAAFVRAQPLLELSSEDLLRPIRHRPGKPMPSLPSETSLAP